MVSGRLITLVLLVAICAATESALAWSPGDPEFRAYWVDAWHAGFKSAAQCDQLIAEARAARMNAIVVQMRRRGDTYYPSPYEPWASDADPSFDALAYLVQKAHTGTPRLDVHVWFVTYPIASAGSVPSNPNHPYNKYPQWIMKDESGGTNAGDNYWFDPGVPEVEQYTYNVIMDVVNRYDVDGIHFDYVRYPGECWGYNDIAVQRFNTLYNRTGRPSCTDSQWKQFRRDAVTALVRKVYANAAAVKPGIVVSAATIGWGNGPTTEDGWYSTSAYSKVYQDWRSWMAEGILDLNIPMFYYDCGSQQWSWFVNWLCYALNHKYGRECAIGLDFYGNTAECIADQVDAVRYPPCSGNPHAYGYCGYSYAYRNTALMQSLNAQNVGRPTMLWKTNPTLGHIKGTVTRGGVGWLDGATVTATGPVSRSTSTDGTGFYAFIDLPPGTYTVAAYKSGYGSRSASPNPVVAAGVVTTADIDYPESLTISNVQAGNENGSQFTITWTTNLPSTSQVAWGLDRSCPNLTTENTNAVTSHSVTLTGLQPLTAYYFKVISRIVSPPAVAESAVYAWATGATKYDYIIDNPQATLVGSWLTGTTSADKYGADYNYTSGAVQGKSATWTPNIARAGNYKVYVWYPAGSNRYTASPYTVYYSGGSQLYTVNQTTGGGQWNLLGTHPFAAGTSGRVTLTNNGVPSDKNVMADAVRFEEVLETTPPSVPTNLQAVALSDSQISLTWNASTDNVVVAGYRVYRGGSCIAICTTNSYVDTGLTQNTSYTYSVSAFDTSGNKSANSSNVSRYTLCKAPTPETVTCNKAAGVWHTANPFTFTAVGGFGPGKVYYYQVAWDTSPSHIWTGSETTWMFGTISFNAVTGPNPYYLHIRGYNQEGVPCQPSDFGPYYLDATAPSAPVVTDDGEWTASGVEIHASWTSSDPDSGIEGFQYAVGTTPGGDDVVNWTPCSNTSETVTIPEQQAGTVLYFGVKARNGAGLWSGVGSTDGITVGVPLGSCAEAKEYADGTVVRLTGRVVTAVFADCFYVADPNRLGGLRVNIPGRTFALGTPVDVGGRLTTTAGGERALANAYAAP